MWGACLPADGGGSVRLITAIVIGVGSCQASYVPFPEKSDLKRNTEAGRPACMSALG